MAAAAVTIICMFGCGHKIVGTMSTPDLYELMEEHYHVVHRRQLEALVKVAD